ncbi:MAG: nodulation protein NfeD [candidate division WOR-3 bacterium]
MKFRERILLFFLLPFFLFAKGEFYILTLKGAIGPASRDYILRAIREAKENGASLLLLKLDTPGGLDLAMREICQGILQSKVPFLTFVYPPGARAASAGTFIVMASHFAAMAQGTSIGAAHPVTIGGKDVSGEMKEKVENDAVAYLVSLAKTRGRDTIFAEEAVRKSATLTAEQALKKGVIDFLANSEEELLEKVKIKGVAIEREKNFPMNPRETFLHYLTDPNLAYILLVLGMYGIIFELQAPGAIFPGVFGGLSLILALYSFQIVPVNYAGLALIALSFILLFLELKITSYGLLTIGAIISFFLGSFLLLPKADFPLSTNIIIIAGIVTILFFLLILSLAIKAHRKEVLTGKEGMVNLIGEVAEDFSERGRVFVRGEYWESISLSGLLKKGEKVRVVDVSGMVLKVERLKETSTS